MKDELSNKIVKVLFEEIDSVQVHIIDLKNAVIDVDYDKIAIRIVKELKEFYNA